MNGSGVVPARVASAEGDPTRAEEQVAADRRLDGQVAGITGAAGVIGRAIARRFVEAGARVALGDLDGAQAIAAARQLGGEDRAAGMEFDVTSREACRSFVASTAAAFGRLDILVCAAGITHVDRLLAVDEATWRRVFAVNLEGVLWCLQAAAEVMGAQPVHAATGRRGTVVGIGSQGGEFPLTTSTAYGASKRALVYLTQTAAVELAPSSIGVSVVLPGMVYEGMWRSVNATRSQMRGEDFARRIHLDLAETPTGRFQRPEDLADMVLFAATSRGLELNGKTLWSEAHVT